MIAASASTRGERRGRSGFTLIELLAVMGILVLLAVLTLVGVGRISKEARVSAAVNRVSAVIANARAIAIRENRVVMVVFRVNWPTVGEPCDLTAPPANLQQRQFTEMVTAIYTGDSRVFTTGNRLNLSERFVVLDEVAPVALPAGIKVAAPNYDYQDFFGNPLDEPPYMTQGEMREFVTGCNENPEFSRLFGVMFGPDGRLIARLPSTASGDAPPFVDFNQTACGSDGQDVLYRFPGGCNPNLSYLFYNHPRDETNVYLAPYLVIYDDDAARERKTLDWASVPNMITELVGPEGFIALFGERITFNPNTGVVQR
jgi:prepilin-type N-terminal cleavage/methylation domain-containing protein